MGASANGHYDGPSPVLRWATNEWTLLFVRGVVVAFAALAGIAGTLALFVLNDIRSSAADLKSEISDIRRIIAIDQVADANRMGRIEGSLGEIKGVVDAHRQRLETHDRRMDRYEDRLAK